MTRSFLQLLRPPNEGADTAMGEVSNPITSAASMCWPTVDSSISTDSDTPAAPPTLRLERASTVRNVFSSFSGLWRHLTGSDLRRPPSTVPERRAFTLDSLRLDETPTRAQSLWTKLASSEELSRDMLYPASTSSARLAARNVPSTSSARLPTLAAISPGKAFRRALSFVVKPEQPLRDREAILERARCRARRRSDATEDRAAIQRAASHVEWPRHRRASL